MRLLTWLCAATLLAALGVAAFSQDSGYVLISWGKTSVEMSLVLAVCIAVMTVWLVARLASLTLWQGNTSSPTRQRLLRKISADKPASPPAPIKNWTPSAR